MKIIITTCRRPSRRLRSFVKDLVRVLPGSIRITRGKQSLEDLASLALSLDANLVIIVDALKGNPGRLRFVKVYRYSYELVPFKVIISGVKLIREIPLSDIPTEVRSEVIATYEGASDKVNVLCEKLADLLNFPYIEVKSLNELKGAADIIMWIVPSRRDLARIEFVNGRSSNIAGPIIRVKKVIT
ncbi:MAG: hypothetical protein DRJ66_02515 [Thermoprotei archaeon]|nr:MAG: hypothetical protein DRJ66_02515 [Thermoprotei archaeon]